MPYNRCVQNDQIGQRHQVWIAGINWNKGAGYLIRQHWEAGHFQHFTSGEILFEIIRVLREVFDYSDEQLYQWYWLILAGSVYITPTTQVNVVKDDPDDNKIFACAVDGGADFVVSEDKDLHRVGTYRSIQVVKKQAFLALLEESAK